MKTGWPRRPVIYEINTWVWLYELSRKHGKPVTLATVPDAEWDGLGAYGFDAVWFMGVWERSPGGIAISMKNAGQLADFRRALPDFSPEDNVGSPYCVRRYVVDAQLGGPEGLAAARKKLAARGLRLILDFVPNHVAPDHPWVNEHPEYFIQGTDDDAARQPDAFVRLEGKVLACGRDPYFPAWSDVLQLNAFDAGLRKAAVDTVNSIADQCDGMRCDMAMLLMNPIFERTWGAGRRQAGNRVLAGADRGGPKASSPGVVHRRGLLGSGVGPATAGVRLLLRQATLRSAGTQRGRDGAVASLRRSGLSGATRPLRRKP